MATNKKVKGYGVFVKAYGGLIGFSDDLETARKLKMTAFSGVSMSRSADDFKVEPVTISYPLKPHKHGKKAS